MDVKRLTMKTTLLVIVVLLVGGCGTPAQKEIDERRKKMDGKNEEIPPKGSGLGGFDG
jgi:hypothetical protein